MGYGGPFSSYFEHSKTAILRIDRDLSFVPNFFFFYAFQKFMTKKGVAIREKIRICKFQGGEKVAIIDVGTPPPPQRVST